MFDQTMYSLELLNSNLSACVLSEHLKECVCTSDREEEVEGKTAPVTARQGVLSADCRWRRWHTEVLSLFNLQPQVYYVDKTTGISLPIIISLCE